MKRLSGALWIMLVSTPRENLARAIPIPLREQVAGDRSWFVLCTVALFVLAETALLWWGGPESACIAASAPLR